MISIGGWCGVAFVSGSDQVFLSLALRKGFVKLPQGKQPPTTGRDMLSSSHLVSLSQVVFGSELWKN